jgi:hypothetical protein
MTEPENLGGPTRTEVFIGWLLEALLADATPERQKAFAWNLWVRVSATMEKAETSELTEEEAGALRLARAFLDEMKSSRFG